MNFPALQRADRRREYDSYSSVIKAKVVYSYLFEGLSHRDLDEKVIGLNPTKSRGWQSMGILNFLGLKNSHKNIFNGMDINSAIEQLVQTKTDDSLLIVKHLKLFGNKEILDKESFERLFQEQVEKSRRGGENLRQERLKNCENDSPQQVEVISIAFKRNPDVIASVLERANGICENCRQNAPFLRARDNTPYMEIHHKVRLADGGKDNIENALALCPNCHRKAHFGRPEKMP